MKDLFEAVCEKFTGLIRPKHFTIPEKDLIHGGMHLVYDDNDKRYNVKTKSYTQSVTDYKSFASVIKMEARRRVPEQANGESMAVYLTRRGGKFYPHDPLRRDNNYTFERTLSQQWLCLNDMLNKSQGHLDFLISLQRLKPSLKDFNEVYRAYQKLKYTKNMHVDSSPLVTEDGKFGEVAAIEYTIRGGDGKPNQQGEAKVPIQLELEMSYSKNSQSYLIPVEILIRESNYKPHMIMICPQLEAIEEQALKDEAELFRDLLKEYKELWIHNDY